MNEQNRTYRLRFNHKDFICQQLALFKPHRAVARELLKKFPNIPLTAEQALTRVHYYSASNRTYKWRNRINEYRRMLNQDLANRFRLVNEHQRIMEFERIFADAMKPRVRRIIWYPVTRTAKGEITYGRKEIYERDLSTAITVLTTIPKEIDDYCLSKYAPPVRIRKSRSSEEIIQTLQKQLKHLDLTFGLQ